MDVVYLTRDTVVQLHDECIDQYTPSEPREILSEHLLESALDRGPQKRYYVQDSDIFEIVAAVAGGIIRNHPFANANKRTAFACAVVMLYLNGYQFSGETRDAIHIMVSLAGDAKLEDDLAGWLRAESVLLEPAET